MPDTARRYTVDQVQAFPDDGNRYELVDGELLVTPAPAQRHEIVLFRLADQVYRYLESVPGVAQAFFSRGDVIWGPGEYVQPDLFVVPAHEVTGNWRDCQHLLLVAEIVSPSSAWADRVRKRALYQRRGVATPWVVDIDARVVEGWRPGQDRPEIAADVIRWRVTPEAPDLMNRPSRPVPRVAGVSSHVRASARHASVPPPAERALQGSTVGIAPAALPGGPEVPVSRSTSTS